MNYTPQGLTTLRIDRLILTLYTVYFKVKTLNHVCLQVKQGVEVELNSVDCHRDSLSRHKHPSSPP